MSSLDYFEREKEKKLVREILKEMEEHDNGIYQRVLKNAKKRRITPEEYFVDKCIRESAKHEYDYLNFYSEQDLLIKLFNCGWTHADSDEEDLLIDFYEYICSCANFKNDYIAVIYPHKKYTEVYIAKEIEPTDEDIDEIYSCKNIEGCTDEYSGDFADRLIGKIFNSPEVKNAIFEYEQKNFEEGCQTFQVEELNHESNKQHICQTI